LPLTPAEKAELLELLKERELRTKQRSIDGYFPETGPLRRELYHKVIEFFAKGSDHKLRLLRAGNRVGKTFAVAFEVVCHLTGDYPPWWVGRRFKFPTNWWVCGVDSKIISGVLQPLLLGPIGSFGTGMIPYNSLDFDSLRDAKKADTNVPTFRVKHKTGAYSSVTFKSYESGREAFQSANVCVWLDEEPPLSIYTECLLRTAATGGEPPILIMTFTPLKGISETVLSFQDGDANKEGDVGVGKWVSRIEMDDVPHLSAEDKAVLLAAIPPWARDARIRGIPSMGSGAIYPIPWTDISVPRFEIPKHWKRCAGMDVGGKTAAIWFAQSPDNGTWYGYHEYYREGELPSVHAQGIAAPGQYVPIAIDSAAHARSQIDGENLFQLYKDLGLQLHNANKAVETGLYLCWELLSSGKVKLFNDLKRFEEEYVLYRRDEKGRIVKERDHCFTGDTLVWTDQGKLPIKDLVGTTGRVWSTNGFEAYQNCRLIERDAKVVDVVFKDGVVTCTSDHLFLTVNGWAKAENLVGCFVVTVEKDLPKVCLEVRQREYRTSRADVYCLDVPTTHAFAVGPGVIVHNCMDAFRYCMMTGRELAVNEAMSKPAAQYQPMVSPQYRPQPIITRR
jgi:phage terminase large subunit-like protein